MKNSSFYLILLLLLSGLSFSKELAPTEDRSKVEFFDLPGHIIGEYSDTLIKHLEANGTKEITAVIEITNNVFGEVSYSTIEIAGLKKWYSAFGYGGTRGDPKKSPFE